MKVFNVTCLALLLLSSGAVATPDAADVFNPEVAPGPVVQPDFGNLWVRGGSVLYDNGQFADSPGTGVGGADESILQSVTLGMNTLGFGHQFAFDNVVADDFTIPGDVDEWQIDDITFFAYQTGSTTVSTMTGARVQIWDGPPAAPGSTVVFGDLTTNVLASSSWSGVYRVTETTTGVASDRPIMANTVTVGISLPPGTYWLAWQADGSLGSGPWAPPLNISGQSTTGNGLQSLDAGVTYPDALDSGTLTQQGFPFVINGTEVRGNVLEIPTASTVGLVALGLLLGLGALFTLRRMA
ncbi:MAG: hypothetical protein DWQ36_02815 [Acidobacteria bacterium]|nr:MAG: hypothetical protein DWQ30_02590 [Acidobacteriota bacterium]REK11058.1 MAG: hypothetical protein DWQ36_02815 [Acidobacteriota bacterium]